VAIGQHDRQKKGIRKRKAVPSPRMGVLLFDKGKGRSPGKLVAKKEETLSTGEKVQSKKKKVSFNVGETKRRQARKKEKKVGH